MTFAAYGELLAVHGADAVAVPSTARLTSLGYSGEHFDARAQQQYLRARWYDPTNGRFNRLDPFAGNTQDPQSLHKYAYVHGDPINLADPTGEFASLGGAMVAGAVRAGLISMGIGAIVRVPIFVCDVYVGGQELGAALWDLGISSGSMSAVSSRSFVWISDEWTSQSSSFIDSQPPPGGGTDVFAKLTNTSKLAREPDIIRRRRGGRPEEQTSTEAEVPAEATESTENSLATDTDNPNFQSHSPWQ